MPRIGPIIIRECRLTCR